MDIQIELPSLKYKDSFLKAVQEFQQLESHRSEDREYDEYPLNMTDNDFENLVIRPKLDAIKGLGLPQGYVPCTEFWIIDNDGFSGRVSLRHFLSDYLKNQGGHIGYAVCPSKRQKGYVKTAFRLVLKEAAKMGIRQVLMTCDEDNVGSKKTITCGLKEFGGYEDVPYKATGQMPILRYWINTKQRD